MNDEILNELIRYNKIKLKKIEEIQKIKNLVLEKILSMLEKSDIYELEPDFLIKVFEVMHKAEAESLISIENFNFRNMNVIDQYDNSGNNSLNQLEYQAQDTIDVEYEEYKQKMNFIKKKFMQNNVSKEIVIEEDSIDYSDEDNNE